ncbi:hypothetical protein V5799_007073 [Amblyomma americanum]|uniref:Uncharacterized protein n=1 Tax=Amblyomma americanum TaxID=6943 RepID=A0AAQ4DUK8_AMBAM
MHTFNSLVEHHDFVLRDVHWLIMQEDEANSLGSKAYDLTTPSAKVSFVKLCKSDWRKTVVTPVSSPKNAASLRARSGRATISMVAETKTRLGGESLKLGCLRVDGKEKLPNHCERRQYKYLIRLLQWKNVSITFENTSSLHGVCVNLIYGSVDVFLLNMAFTGEPDCSVLFANAEVLSETFYAMANGTRVISFLEILSCSLPGVALTVSSFIVCVVLLAYANSGLLTLRIFLGHVAAEATFLLATLFAQSSPLPQHRRRRNTRRVLYLLLLLGIFPLSVYIRGQLTSWITVTRPADHLDTLDELERALDAGAVAACTARDTPQAAAMVLPDAASSSIMAKLREAFRRHGGSSLVMPTASSCLRCTRRSDRVCFTPVQPACVVNEESPAARPFREHLGTALTGVPLRHGLPLQPALRNLLLRATEGALHTEAAPDCKYKQPPAPAKQEIELLAFFQQYYALLAFAVLVFFAECVVGWYLKVR